MFGAKSELEFGFYPFRLKAKFHYAIWFEAGRQPGSNLSATSFEPDSVMEFGFYRQKFYS